MKKLIFKKFNQDILKFFVTFLLIMSLIVWIIQAVNYFDFVTEDGHGLKVYFFYTLLNFPKIVHRILPFIFFISLFYIILQYENKNELNLFWFNGISKIFFAKKLLLFSLIIFLVQIFLGSFLSPKSQYEARNFLKNSNIDFFTSLIKEGKFINVAKDLTIFIKEKNDDGSYNDIFLDDSKNDASRMIYAKKGILLSNDKNKVFRLINGKIINYKNFETNTFKFDEIDFSLNNFDSQTIIVPKIQEISTRGLLGCFFNINSEVFESFNCGDNVKNEIVREIMKRLYKPIYIPLISLLSCFLIIYDKNHVNQKRNINIIFFLIIIILVISEVSLRNISLSFYSMFVYILIPWIIFIFSYIFFNRISNNV